MALKINDLCKSYEEKMVLCGLEYTLEDHGIYCLMGPSGMGKTTLLRIILGLETADQGTVEGVPRDQISAMFQEDRLIPTLTAVENVALVSPRKADPREIARQLTRILPENCLRQPVNQLSGGMKRRVALARALHYPSKMIILDEPFTGLDQATKMDVISYILDMRGDRILLIATHGVNDAALLGAETINLDELQSDLCPFEEEEVLDGEPPESRDEILGRMRMFRDIPPERMDSIIEKLDGREVEYQAKEIIWQQFEPSSDLGIVLSGSIQAEDISREEPQIIQRFSAGCSFGEGIAFGEHSCWVCVKATEDCRILFLSAKAFLQHQTDPDVVKVLINLLGEFSNKLELMTLKNQLLSEPRVRNRLLMYLSTLETDADGFKTVPFMQKDLALYLNVNRSSFNRELGRMKGEGILEIEDKKVRVHWTDSLRSK